MTKRTGPSNPYLQSLIADLKKKALAEGVGVWKAAAKNLEKPTRLRRQVNIYKIDKNLQDGELALVPGKVLGVGELSKPVTVAAFAFSQEAKNKIQASKGKTLTINELMEQNPKGKGVRILG